MIFARSRSTALSLASRSARSLLRRITLVPPPFRMPAIMEAWFFSSEKMIEFGSSFCRVASVVSLAT
jgi:hypothetical protein